MPMNLLRDLNNSIPQHIAKLGVLRLSKDRIDDLAAYAGKSDENGEELAVFLLENVTASCIVHKSMLDYYPVPIPITHEILFMSSEECLGCEGLA